MVSGRACRLLASAAGRLRIPNGGGLGVDRSGIVHQRLREDLGAQRPAGISGAEASGTFLNRDALAGGALPARCHSGLGSRPAAAVSPTGQSIIGLHDGLCGTGMGGWVRHFHATGMAAARNYYEVLGVAKDASPADIKKAFYALAQKYHPDKNTEDKEAEGKFQEVQEAYETLKDANKRALYDQVGPEGYANAQNGGAGPGGGFNGGFQGFGGGFRSGGTYAEDFFGGLGGEAMEDLFRQAFGGEVRGRAGTGPDVRLALELSFREAVEGCTKRVQFHAPSRCASCNGTGAPKGTPREQCKTCYGRGKIQMVEGNFFVTTSCSACGGSGQTTKEVCKACMGDGVVMGTQELEVKIPAGVESGMSMRISGKGGEGPRGYAPGDVMLTMKVRKDKVFRREGNNLHTDVPISFTQAALGGQVNAATLTGAMRLKVRPGTQPGERAVLRGKGVKHMNRDAYGDHYVHFQVQIPTQLSPRQRELLEELAKEEENGGEAENDQATA